MRKPLHPYYAGLWRYAAHHGQKPAPFAEWLGLHDSTVRKALGKGSGPQAATIDKVKAKIGLDYQEIIDWQPPAADATREEAEPDPETELAEGFRNLSQSDQEHVLAVLQLVFRGARRGPE